MSNPTITRDEAEIVVVGGGPSGSTTAALLAELGHDVLIVDKDKFPREKPCGDGLMHPAVAAAERMGLGDLIESSMEIEAARFVIGHRRQAQTRFTSSPGRPQPRCITRKDFDAGLLAAAQARGARFLCARVDGIEGDDGNQRLLAVADGESFAVTAGTVVAADGATSRLRRATTTGGPSKPTGYAVRQYFVSEKPLDPVFDCYLPLEIDGRALAGYGWVFPIDEHKANVGVGIFYDAYRDTPLTRVLESFIRELKTKAAYRFGDLEAISEPFGSPLGIRAPLAVSGMPGVILAGDAAGTTHPVTGEGIPFAMKGGEAVARTVHARSKGRAGSPPAGQEDAALWRPFPQLGVDATGLNRVGALEMNRGTSEATGSSPEPFLVMIKRLQVESAYETGAEGTPAWNVLNGFSPSLGECLEGTNDALLDGLLTQMPFVAEVIHRSIRSHLGPMYAAVTIATAGSEVSDLPRSALEAAVAAEAVGILPDLLTMLADRASSKILRVNNALAVLSGDFAATRALTAATKLGTPAVAALALACQQGCEGGMRDASARFDSDRDIEDWFRAASETAGAAAVLATQLGTIVRGKGDASADTLHRYAIELGIAIRLAEEIVDLTLGEEMHPGHEGADLRRGIYSLPVLYALDAEQRLPRMLAQHTAENGSPAEIISLVRESGGLDRAIAECASRADAASSAAQALPGSDGEVLAALAGAVVDYVASRVSVDDAGGALSVTG